MKNECVVCIRNLFGKLVLIFIRASISVCMVAVVKMEVAFFGEQSYYYYHYYYYYYCCYCCLFNLIQIQNIIKLKIQINDKTNYTSHSLKLCLFTSNKVECLGVSFGVLEGGVFNLGGNFVAVMVKLRMEDFELVVQVIVRQVWGCLSGRVYVL